jgi:single-strand DNA-binding protein
VQNINAVVISGNLTRDPELRQLASGTSLCTLRVAVNESVKDRDSGQWGDRANYFDVTVWAGQAESCSRYLQKGSGVIVQGRLRWEEWQAQDGTNRQTVKIVADRVEFKGGRDGGGRDSGRGRDDSDFTPAAAPSGGGGYTPSGDGRGYPTDESDIPFAWHDTFDPMGA